MRCRGPRHVSPRLTGRKEERLDAEDREPGRRGSAQAVRCESLGVRDEANATMLGADGTSASRLMTEVHWGLPANCCVGPADASLSIGALRQQSSVLPGWLHSDALFLQQAIAAGPESSQ